MSARRTQVSVTMAGTETHIIIRKMKGVDLKKIEGIPPEEMERLWLRYQPIVYNLAWKFSKKYGRPLEEMVDVGHGVMAITICDGSYNSEKSKWVTWIWQKVYWALTNYCQRNKRKREVPIIDEDYERPAKVSWLERIFRELSDEGKTLLRVICEAPGELANTLFGERGVQDSVQDSVQVGKAVLFEFLEQNDWEKDKIDRAWKEVEYCVQH